MAADLALARDVGLILFAAFLLVAIGVSAFRVYMLANKRMLVTQTVHRASKVDADANESRSSCLICLDDYEEGDLIGVLECKHAFHKRCLKKLKNHRSTTQTPPGALPEDLAFACPICREGIRIV